MTISTKWRNDIEVDRFKPALLSETAMPPKTPALTLVAPAANELPPPPHLDRAGRDLWTGIQTEDVMGLLTMLDLAIREEDLAARMPF